MHDKVALQRYGLARGHGHGDLPVPHGRQPVLRRTARLLVVLVCLAPLGGAAVLASVLLLAGRTPGEWAPYILKRSTGHRPSIEAAGATVAGWLEQADRLGGTHAFHPPPGIGAAPDRSGIIPGGRMVPVDSMAGLLEAVARAIPGDVIELAAGVYRRTDFSIALRQPGREDAPITLRAPRLGAVVIESAAPVGFTVAAPFWRFENLIVRGACPRPADCDHAFHVTGHASGTAFRNNRLEDFNAALKINGENGTWPDGGLIEGNTLINTFARETTKPITLIDLVGASHWMVRANLLADFARAWPGPPAYGVFAKGGGTGTTFERNIVLCEWHLRTTPGQHVALSLGGGGTAGAFMRDPGHGGPEQSGGIIRDNLLAACNDDGIYLNRAARSAVEHNTLLDTAGIEARSAETSATVNANLVDGAIRRRDGAVLQQGDNAASFLLELFGGWHRQRAAFADPATLDLRWRKVPDRVMTDAWRTDLCGQPRGATSFVGAFENYAACLSAPGQLLPAQ